MIQLVTEEVAAVLLDLPVLLAQPVLLDKIVAVLLAVVALPATEQFTVQLVVPLVQLVLVVFLSDTVWPCLMRYILSLSTNSSSSSFYVSVL